MRDKVDGAVRVLWGYMQLNQPVQAAAVMLVLGSRDDRVATYAATLLQNVKTQCCVVSGGSAHQNDLLNTTWAEGTEADHFVAVMKAAGIDDDLLLVERYATNTGENAIYSYKVLKDAGISTQSLLLVTKPYMERRALATFEVQWPYQIATLCVTSQGGSIEQYCNEQEPYDDVVNIMVGDFQRIVEYPKLGYQSDQPVTEDLLRAFVTLKHAGFTKHLL